MIVSVHSHEHRYSMADMNGYGQPFYAFKILNMSGLDYVTYLRF